MRKIINLIISSLVLTLVLVVSIYTVYSWYVSNNQVTVHGVSGSTLEGNETYFITFNAGEDKVELPLVPSNFSMLKINISCDNNTNAELKFDSTITKWKNISTTFSSLDKKVDFEEKVYYRLNEGEYILIDSKPADWDTNYSSYYRVNDSIVSSLDLGTREVQTPLERLYGINSYYNKNNDDSFSLKHLSLGEKREEFMKLWRDDSKVNIVNSLRVYVSDTLIEEKNYESTLLPIYEEYRNGGNTSFKRLNEVLVDYDSINSEGQSFYFYFYFDERDLYFNTTGSTYFYGENPFFLQTVTLNIFVAKG